MYEVRGPCLAHSCGVTGVVTEGDISRMDLVQPDSYLAQTQDFTQLVESLNITMEQNLSDAMLPALKQLEEAIAMEDTFVTNLELPSSGNDKNLITDGIRDGSAHVLRCLKVWYDLPSDVLFVAINYMDRFLSKMKVQARHMACVSVSSFSLAVQQVALHGGCPETDLKDLALISQSKCTSGDLQRMESIIALKLDVNRVSACGLPTTPLSFLRLYHSLFISSELGVLFQKTLSAGAQGPDIWQRLEIVVCDSKCSTFRPSVIALVLLCSQLQAGVEAIGSQDDPALCAQLVQLISFAVCLQKISQISAASFSICLEAVNDVMTKYNAQSQMPHRQRLVWKLSHRTRRLLRPIDRLAAQLPTIEEHKQFAVSESRQRSGSVSSEESSESEKEESCNQKEGAHMLQDGVEDMRWFKIKSYQ
ncbi:hypothetical protein FOCC_FOCC016386 [Frankliniella occidentalis]|nr:hypothetical protein FOCC_FOCC016386 [Frankliniella occidentalis]